jgi:hypothetical protein
VTVPLFKLSLKADTMPGRAVPNWLWLALANQRLGIAEEARRWLGKAQAWLDQYGDGMPARAEAELGLHLQIWQEAHVPRREAGTLIQSKRRWRSVALRSRHCGHRLGLAVADSASRKGEMVDVPASPVTQLPHQRLARSETTSGRLVQVIRDSSSRLFAPKNTPEIVSSPRFRTNWFAEVRGPQRLGTAVALSSETNDASAPGFSKGSYP